MSSLLFGPSQWSTASDGYHIAYEELNDFGRDFYQLCKHLSYNHHRSSDDGENFEIYQSFVRVVNNSPAAHGMDFFRGSSFWLATQRADAAAHTALKISDAISMVGYFTNQNEKKVMHEANYASGNGAVRSPGFDTPSHAESFYEAAAAAEAQRLKEEEEAAAAAAATAAAAAAAAAEQQAMDDYVKEHWPEVWAEIEEKRRKAEEDEWLEGIKEKDPELYEAIMAERKRQEEARKAAEEAEAALAEELAAAGDGLGSDFGGSSLGSGDSSFGADDSGFGGGGGGGGGLGSFDDWSDDLISDTIDGEELGAAGEALDDIAGVSSDAASAYGADAIDSATDLAAEEGFFAHYGDQLATFATAYGLQTAAVIGGGIALYATREQTTEAVAHVAEFVSTKCKPFAIDVVEQVKGAAKKTRVNLANTKSKVVGVTRGEEAGDLIG